MIETELEMKRRELAIDATDAIIHHPAYPFKDDFPRAMILIIEKALETWEGKTKCVSG